MRCLFSGRHTMSARLLSPQADNNLNTTQSTGGKYVYEQDPISGEVISVWKDVDSDSTTAGVQSSIIPCTVRGIISEGVSSAGASEVVNPRGEYSNIEYVKMTFPKDYVVTQRDRITDVKDASGRLLWNESEYDDSKATVFNVNGVIPVLDPFNQLVEWVAFLERSEDQ